MGDDTPVVSHMGYTTSFDGSFKISPALTDAHSRYLQKFSRDHDDRVGDGTNGECPGGYCQWIPKESTELVWDGGEKFYDYVEWLQYLILDFFTPNGYVLNGSVTWSGESGDDFGVIRVFQNEITTRDRDDFLAEKVEVTEASCRRAIDQIIANLTGCLSLGNAWVEMNTSEKQEVRDTWVRILKKNLD